jgi:hypothetical protein
MTCMKCSTLTRALGFLGHPHVEDFHDLVDLEVNFKLQTLAPFSTQNDPEIHQAALSLTRALASLGHALF